MFQRYMANRWVHSLILTLMVVGILGVLFASIDTVTAGMIALVPILTWMMGRFHARAVIIETGLADESDLRDAEREHFERQSLLRKFGG